MKYLNLSITIEYIARRYVPYNRLTPKSKKPQSAQRTQRIKIGEKVTSSIDKKNRHKY
ncbi:MAG: hypothetical protein WCE94_01770 [Candidatus Methanoperedens sp.]